ncbi:TonB-dependent receptor [Sphingomonas sp. BK580]|uniref:TonB-dependent receptor n=1 Tax=Sphingomonas sp. BK580 TaxID=2586972 RepID=UPI00161EC271|nr:TonB-dependent receptor [Sphingomonas sp. BK580]MBB3695200.1 TonB-dependent receptor [Sphingomonas sp. BK580]
MIKGAIRVAACTCTAAAAVGWGADAAAQVPLIGAAAEPHPSAGSGPSMVGVAVDPASGGEASTKAVIEGRILNAVTGEYVRNADVRVAGTSLIARSDDDGRFRIAGVPAGDVEVVVSYTGLQEARAAVHVAPGGAAAQDFTLTAPSFAVSDADDAQAIVVTARRGGQAAAIMDRRAAINAKTVVSADNYGFQTMGDVGEFLKSMPGISLDYTEVDATAVRIGGLDPKYSTFTVDGSRLATATSNNNSGRQNSFEQMSITGIDTIELNNTLTASMDADSPGGNINLRSKYAFERKRRRVSLQVGAVGTSDSGFSRRFFPDDRTRRTIYPSVQLSYADVFLEGRLGLAVNASHYANYVQQDREQVDWSYLASGRIIPYQLMYRPGPKTTTRDAINLAVDYKITDDLAVSLRGTYSKYGVEYFNQYTYLIFGTTAVSQTTADSTPTHIVVNPNGTNTRLSTQYSHRFAGTPATLIAPKLEYRGDEWEAVLRGSYSTSAFHFRDNSKGFFQRDDSWLTRIGFTLDRDSTESQAWTLAQTAGRPWSDPASYNRDDDIGNNVRSAESDARDKMYGGFLDVKRILAVDTAEVTLLAGAGIRKNDWRTNEGSYQQFQYVGPTGDLTQKAPEAVIPATQNYQFEIIGFDAGNLNEQRWRADNNSRMYAIYRDHPEYFVADEVGNLKRRLDNDKRIREQIKSAYIEAQTRVGAAKFDIGLRYEQTDTGAKVADVRTAQEVAAAGLSISTPAGLLYQYNGGTYSTRRGSYDDWFLSGGVKYDFSKRLVAQFAFSQSLLRPDYGNLGRVVSVNDDTQIVSVPNPLLKPEHSVKYFASVQYYLEPSGIIALSGFKLDVKDMQVTGVTVDASAVGYDPDEYAGYIFRSTQNMPGVSTNKGLTAEYDQQLTFLPGLLKGLGLRASYTRVDPDSVRVNLPKDSANWGIRYSYGPADIQLTGNYQSTYRTSALSNTPTTANNGVLYHADRTLWNVSASYRIRPGVDFVVAGRNIFNAPDVIYSNVKSRVQQYSIYGSLWNASIRAVF